MTINQDFKMFLIVKNKNLLAEIILNKSQRKLSYYNPCNLAKFISCQQNKYYLREQIPFLFKK